MIYFLLLLLPTYLLAVDPVIQLPFHSYPVDQSKGLEEVLLGRAESTFVNITATVIFALAVIHTLLAGKITEIAHHFEKKRGRRDAATEALRFLGEVEIIFGIWVLPLVFVLTFSYGWDSAVGYLNSRDYKEALAVVAVMTLVSSYPIVRYTESALKKIAHLFGGGPKGWWISLLTIGPLLGSVITEAGAMVLTATLLAKQLFSRNMPRRFAYATLGLLFTNVACGGMITNFASPPALMVAEKWDWTAWYMFRLFGWKTVLTVLINTGLYYLVFRRKFQRLHAIDTIPQHPGLDYREPRSIPLWILGCHLAFLAAIVCMMQETVIFVGLFLFYLGFYQATSDYQTPIKLRQPLLVGLFIAALVIHGGMQEWWIAPILSRANEWQMLAVSVILGPITDNAALAYLATFIPNLALGGKYAAMVGICSVGGLTVIANAPNPAGFQILNHYFEEGISATGLFLSALPAAVISLIIYILLFP